MAAASPSGRSSVDGSRESKRERLLVQGTQPAPGGTRSGSSPLQPFDVNAEPLMSERIRQGKPLVSTRKLPKWAQVRLLAMPLPCMPHQGVARCEY